MKAPIRGVLILATAVITHGEAVHRGKRPVIGSAADDGVARTTVGAVDKRVEIAAILGIEEFAPAVSTEGLIGRNKRTCSSRWLCLAGDDGKGSLALWR